jgi:hypothetical protein
MAHFLRRHPRQPSAWFNHTWSSSSVCYRSAAVMFDASKCYNTTVQISSATCTTMPSPTSRNIINCNSVSLVDQAIRHCAHHPRNSYSISHSQRQRLLGHRAILRHVIASTLPAIGTADRNTRSDANATNGRNSEGTTLSANLH